VKLLKLMFALVLLPGLAVAQGGSGTTTISSLLLDSSYNELMIVGTTPWSNPDGCANSTIVLVPTSSSMYKDILAAALTALAAGKTVSFWVTGCPNSAWGTAPQAVLIQINS
jgi:hypothetical protein